MDDSAYSNALDDLFEDTVRDKNPKNIKLIMKMFDDESWNSIVDKWETEGSDHYVWWMDGVCNYKEYLNK